VPVARWVKGGLRSDPRQYSQGVTEPATAPEAARFQPQDWWLLVGAAAMWGTSFLFMDIGLDAFEPGLVTLLRVGFGCVTLWLLPVDRASVPRSDWPAVAVLGVTWMALPLTLFPLAQQWIDSSLAGMLNSAMPVFTVIMAVALFGAPVSRAQISGVIVGLGGIVLIGLPEMRDAGGSPLGVALVIGAVMSYGIAVNVSGPLQRVHGALPVIRRSLLVATVLTLPFGVIDATRSSFAWGPLIACAVLGMGGTGIAFVLASTLSGRVGAVRTSIVTYLIPVVSAVLGVSFRDETITALAVAGTLVVLLGAWMSSRT
jgi:drug/metabolite transporter (DMT)-like permease